MKVLFSNPPWWEKKEGGFLKRRWRAGVRAGSRWPSTQRVHSKPDDFWFGDYLPYPMFMGYATTYARKNFCADVKFRDSIALRESYKSYLRHLIAEQYDYIFFEIATPSWGHDRLLIRKIHDQFPKTKIIVAGPIAATRSEEILARYPVHACIRGEYEKASVRILKGESGLIDFDLLTPEEMNAAPFPYFDDEYMLRYWDCTPVGQKSPHAQVWSSRGCPFKCIFCVWPATMTGNDYDGTKARTVRYYTPEYMESFIKELLGRFDFKCIYFDDDTFNLNDSHVIKMCEIMRRIGIPWSAMCRPDTIKLETWRIMKESGCFGVKIGFESGSQFVIDKIINKHLNIEQAKEVVYELKRIGMTVHGTFTYGLPGETKEQMLETRRLIASLPFDSYQESGCAVIDGTPLHTLIEKGSLNRYEGAYLNKDFRIEVDGKKKWQRLLKELR